MSALPARRSVSHQVLFRQEDFLFPTTITTSRENIKAALRNIRSIKNGRQGCLYRRIHIETLINAEKKGTRPNWIVTKKSRL